MRGFRQLLGAGALVVMIVATAACAGGPGPLFDNVPPVIKTPDSVTVAAPDASGVRVEINQIADDNYDGYAYDPVICDTPPGKYPIGDTTVECASTDRAGNTSHKSTVVTVTPPTGDPVVEVDVDIDNACARYSSGSIRCWGAGEFGKIGNGNTEYQQFPAPVSGITTATQVTMMQGVNPVCALLADRTVWCWGPNVLQADGSHAQQDTPMPLAGFTDVVAIDGGCAVLADRTVRCWSAQVVSGGVPGAPLVGLNDVESLGAVCAVIAGGTARCWGQNAQGQLGNGTVTAGYFPPTDVVGISGVRGVDGGWVNCAVLEDTTVWCWGYGEHGTLGNGTHTKIQPVPVRVAGLVGASTVAVGESQACAIRFDGTGACWGLNAWGQLGNGTLPAPLPSFPGPDESVPVVLKGVTNAVSVSLTGGSGCVVNADGTVRCWGQSLAHGDDSGSVVVPSPITVSGLN